MTLGLSFTDHLYFHEALGFRGGSRKKKSADMCCSSLTALTLGSECWEQQTQPSSRTYESKPKNLITWHIFKPDAFFRRRRLQIVPGNTGAVKQSVQHFITRVQSCPVLITPPPHRNLWGNVICFHSHFHSLQVLLFWAFYWSHCETRRGCFIAVISLLFPQQPIHSHLIPFCAWLAMDPHFGTLFYNITCRRKNALE